MTGKSAANKCNIGLTGGIGSGKTTVSDMFASLGVNIIDADVISRQLTEPAGAAIPFIRYIFGDGAISSDGSLNRPTMRELVLNDSKAMQDLKAVIHPMVYDSIRSLATKSPPPGYNLIVVPLFFESGTLYTSWVDRVVVVDSDETTQVARTMRRDGVSERSVVQMLSHQATRQQRLDGADYVIRTSGVSLNDVQQQVLNVHHKLNLLRC